MMDKKLLIFRATKGFFWFSLSFIKCKNKIEVEEFQSHNRWIRPKEEEEAEKGD